jgi:hypothetical protein
VNQVHCKGWSTGLLIKAMKAGYKRTDDGAPCSSSSRRAASCVCSASCLVRLRHTQQQRFVWCHDFGVGSAAKCFERHEHSGCYKTSCSLGLLGVVSDFGRACVSRMSCKCNIQMVQPATLCTC